MATWGPTGSTCKDLNPFLDSEEGNTGIAYQIGFGLGNYIASFLGAVLATFLAMKFKFSFKNKLFYYALFGSISLGTILLLVVLWKSNLTK